MEIRYKLYPYPVLAEFSDDFKSGSYNTDIDLKRDGYNIRIRFLSKLQCDALLSLISEGKAKYLYHLECAQTGYRSIHMTDKEDDSIVLSNKDVSGKLQICPFVVAVKDIEEYTSNDFHDDYSGYKFKIETGCVIAIGRMAVADIMKDVDDLANTPSIFSIVRNADETCRQMLVDMTGRKIIIKLPFVDYYSYKSLHATPISHAILNTVTIIPALTYVLGELKMMSIDDRRENSDSLWYKTLKRVLNSKFNCDLESEEFNEQNSLELAQKLINDPISEAFQVLTSSFEGGDGE